MQLTASPPRRIARLRTLYLALLLIMGNVFLAGCSAQNSPPKFDSARALTVLRKQCEFGPRPVGSTAHDKVRDYLVAELRPYAKSVETQNFQHTLAGRTYKLSNIIARFGKIGRAHV